MFLMDLPQTDVARFSRDIGESIDKVKELRVARFFPPSDYFDIRPNEFDPIHNLQHVPHNQWHWTVSYCPLCVRRGFHASFHQIDMFSRCLIHGAELKKFEGKLLRWNYSRQEERFIAGVYELLFGDESF